MHIILNEIWSMRLLLKVFLDKYAQPYYNIAQTTLGSICTI